MPAAEALRLLGDAARSAIVAGARTGAVKARARLFTVELPNACGRKGLVEEEAAELPPEFWSSDGLAMEADWRAGSFTSWANDNFQRQAFGVEFDRDGIAALAAG